MSQAIGSIWGLGYSISVLLLIVLLRRFNKTMHV